MTIYIDPVTYYAQSPLRYKYWAHMAASGGVDELIPFALSLGLRREWLQTSNSGIVHFDVIADKHNTAITKGAISVTHTQFVKLLSPTWKRPDIRIIHVDDMHKYPDYWIYYMGRNPAYGDTTYGNPHVLSNARDYERPKVVRQYQQYFNMRYIADPDFRLQVDSLVELARYAIADDKPMYFACHCAPKQCHAEIVRMHVQLACATPAS